MKNVGVFFDIDGTLYRDSLMVEHFKKLIKYEVIDPAIWHNVAKGTFHNWDKRQGNYEDYLLEIAEIYIGAMKGMRKEHIEFISNQVIHLKGDRVYRYTRGQIEWHKEQGHKIIFISGSPDYLVSRMAKKYGVTDYRGTKYFVDEDNRFTGEIEQMWDAESKQVAIAELVDEHNIDLQKSYAYGDTNGDFSMLKSVGHPIAINPAKELLLRIRKDEELRKILKIIIERKDVIYELNAETTIL
ncbi:HAD-superfamily subfamily IB hydrolase, TIGR01490 [Alkaliphilus metalliredigens QYMF]|uniref:phosphoserine phosphatase n=1 Tax=Alkaliphilus metalliredigens (strain QYMF) TaxID=293826 RepID=A6TML8_ALKMQ|nr:HAD-IB family hydrolase [Alkaliphilus metalliredigens]ABR47436.1 HAD-superfamily subfamily IB hydrolase, TIGR01490 [Alkaliphilus metalliredigens QYMF]